MASIRKRGNLQWEARIRRKGYPVTCKTFEVKADAEKWAREIEGEMDKGSFVSRTEAENTTLKEAFDRYLVEYIPKFANPRNEGNRVKAIQRRAISAKMLASIRGKDIADYILEREKDGVSGNSIRLEVNTVSKLFRVAATSWGMESLGNPVERAQKPKFNPGRQRRLETGEEARLLSKCRPPFDSVVLFALETTMRREEISTLRWKNVNFEVRTAYLPETKNGEARSVPLSRKALSILEALPGDRQGTKLVFGISADAITKRIRRACRAADIQDLTFHDLRHEATSRLFEKTDLDIMEICKITGHKSLQMLSRYSHLRTHLIADRLDGVKRGEVRI